MNGSEKQVKWAEDIIRKAKAAMDTRHDKAKARYENMVSQNLDTEVMAIEEAFYNAVAKTYQLVKDELDKFDDAGDIINNDGVIKRKALVNAINSNTEAKAAYNALVATGKFTTKQQLFDAFI
jgi:hypothetical protein